MQKHLNQEQIDNINRVAGNLNEKQRRQYMYKISVILGRGGLLYVSETFHISRMTLNKAKKELEKNDTWHTGDRIRKEKTKERLYITTNDDGKKVFTEKR